MIRRAVDADIPALDRLLFQVHQVHHEARPDLFKAGAKKYTDAQLKAILADDKTPVFVAERGGAVVGYAFCIHAQVLRENRAARTENRDGKDSIRKGSIRERCSFLLF